MLERVVLARHLHRLLLRHRRDVRRLGVRHRLRLRAGLLLRRRVARRECVGDSPVVAAVRIVDAERVQRLDERVLRVRERDAILRAARPGERRLDIAEVELDHLRVRRMIVRVVPQHVLLAVRLDERDAFVRASGEPEVLQGHLVDGEEPARRAVLGTHVPECGAVGECE